MGQTIIKYGFRVQGIIFRRQILNPEQKRQFQTKHENQGVVFTVRSISGKRQKNKKK